MNSKKQTLSDFLRYFSKCHIPDFGYQYIKTIVDPDGKQTPSDVTGTLSKSLVVLWHPKAKNRLVINRRLAAGLWASNREAAMKVFENYYNEITSKRGKKRSSSNRVSNTANVDSNVEQKLNEITSSDDPFIMMDRQRDIIKNTIKKELKNIHSQWKPIDSSKRPGEKYYELVYRGYRLMVLSSKNDVGKWMSQIKNGKDTIWCSHSFDKSQNAFKDLVNGIAVHWNAISAP